ncbi:hypothetical protein H0H87_008901 [Tephrocybe sp. NHM501043]|nr:hypothetical protein H0H87_008901 [Tephrocybe sp. NHM501043]
MAILVCGREQRRLLALASKEHLVKISEKMPSQRDEHKLIGATEIMYNGPPLPLHLWLHYRGQHLLFVEF